MGIIKFLSQDVISKTAAGEVVERPASVVKELIENSLDANATIIKVFIEDYGLKKIRVIDNGDGMDLEDVKSSIGRYSTSKIDNVDDLYSIGSFGFRGEALYTISSVSRLEIISRHKDLNEGNKLVSEGGFVTQVNSVGFPVGTHIEVNDLYFNTPARKKFLKQNRLEFSEILNIVLVYALSKTNVSFYLEHKGRTYIDLPLNQNMDDRIRMLFGNSFFANLIPFAFEGDLLSTATNIKFSGFISKPQLANETHANQFVFVNGRYVEDKGISKLIKEVYGSLLEPRAYPPFILFIDLPVEQVDVNIHPRKINVAFSCYDGLLASLRENLGRLISEANLTYGYEYAEDSFGDRKALSHIFGTLKDSVDAWDVYGKDHKSYKEEILQVGNLYLVLENEKGITLIDQHAAHERILYEQFLDSFEDKMTEEQQKGSMKSVSLEESKFFECPVNELDLFQESMPVFEKLGFEIEFFGSNTIRISSVPLLFKDSYPITLIKNVLDDLKSDKEPLKSNAKVLRTISYLACRGAIKQGDKLTLDQRRRLLEKLEDTKSHYTCPHGRPVRIDLTMSDLGKMFKRIK